MTANPAIQHVPAAGTTHVKVKKTRVPLTKAGALKRVLAVMENLSKDTNAADAKAVAASIASLYG